jgi:hypothetical protein
MEPEPKGQKDQKRFSQVIAMNHNEGHWLAITGYSSRNIPRAKKQGQAPTLWGSTEIREAMTHTRNSTHQRSTKIQSNTIYWDTMDKQRGEDPQRCIICGSRFEMVRG